MEDIKRPSAHIQLTTVESIEVVLVDGSCTTRGPTVAKIPIVIAIPKIAPNTAKILSRLLVLFVG